MHAGEELFSARMAYEAWVAPSLEAAGCVAPRFCGVGTDRSPLIIDAARDVPQLVESEVPPGWRHSPAILLVAPQLSYPASSDGPVGLLGAGSLHAVGRRVPEPPRPPWGAAMPPSAPAKA